MLAILNQRSNSHNSCEDSVYTRKYDNGDIFGCIADGCSTGKNSHFASQLMCYIVACCTGKIITSDLDFRVFIVKMRDIANNLGLNSDYMLSTLTLFYYNKDSKKLVLRFFGDGYYFINTRLTGTNEDIMREYKIDQNNTPDYIGYHLWDHDEELQRFLDKYPIIEHENIDRFIVSSDGLDKISRPYLKKISTLVPPVDNPDILLLSAPTSPNYLERMWNKIRFNHYELSDDLTMVSYCNIPILTPKEDGDKE